MIVKVLMYGAVVSIGVEVERPSDVDRLPKKVVPPEAGRLLIVPDSLPAWLVESGRGDKPDASVPVGRRVDSSVPPAAVDPDNVPKSVEEPDTSLNVEMPVSDSEPVVIPDV